MLHTTASLRLFLRIAVRNLLQARRRSLLLCTVLGLVSMFVVLLMTLTQGVSDSMARSATRLLTGHVNIAGYYKTRPENGATLVTRQTEIAQLARRYVPDAHQIDRTRGWGKLTNAQGSSLDAILTGIDLHAEPHLVEAAALAPQREYVEGGGSSCVGNVEDLVHPHTAVLFAAQAGRLGVRVGDSLTLSVQTLGGVYNTDEVKVVAIVRDAGYLTNRSVFLHKESVRELFALGRDTTGLIMLYLPHMAESAQAASTLRTALSAHGFSIMPPSARHPRLKLQQVLSADWTGQRLDITTWEDELGTTMWVLKTLSTLTALFTTLLMIIVIAGITNTMWIAVRERTQEIGMLRAMGMSRVQVLTMLVLEAFTLSFVATAAGSLGGAALALSVNALQLHIPIEALQMVLMSDVMTLSLRPAHVAQTVVLFSLFTALAALWPALRAARLQPLTAILR